MMAELSRWVERDQNHNMKHDDNYHKTTKGLTSAFFMIVSYVSFEIIGECLFVMGWTYLYSLSITAVGCGGVCVCA